VLGEVTALEHEFRDHTVETRSFVAVTVLTGGKLTEVTSSLGNNIVVELENDTSNLLAVCADIELNKNQESVDTI